MATNKALLPGLSGLSAMNPAGGTGGGGPGFSWGDYTGLQVRYDFSSTSYMTIANSLVSSVTDLTGSGFNAVQANSSLQPTTVTVTGSLLGLQGNAVAFMSTPTTLADNATKTVVAVAKAPEGNTVRYFSGAAQVITADYLILRGTDRLLLRGTDKLILREAAGSQFGILDSDVRSISASTQLADGTYVANTLEIWIAEFNGASSRLYVNGGAAAASGDAGTSLDDSITLLSLADGTRATDGVLGEYARFNRALTTSEKNDIGSFLGTKWSLTWTSIS